MRRIEKLASAMLSAAGVPSAELSLLFVSDRRIRLLNRDYRQKDCSTDVLSFPLWENVPLVRHEVASIPLGDVVISVATAHRQAEIFGHSLHDEIIRLLVHGIVHLLGYDHERGPKEAVRMARKERSILKKVMPLSSLPPLGSERTKIRK